MTENEDPDHEPTRREWVGYWCMIGQQTQNAFNDKAAQFILVPLGGAVGFAVESWAAVMISLPFILFAPLAGWLSDRFSKRDVMLGAAIAQLLILAGLWFAVRMETMQFALVGFFALAVQSAFFSPAKIGINKELVGHRHLGFAASTQQMAAMMAMLIGQIAAGVIYDDRWEIAGRTLDTAWNAAAGPLFILGLLAIPAIGLAIAVPRTPAQGAGPLTAGLLVSHFKGVRDLWAYPGLRQASFAVAFFWGFAAFINLWSVKIAKVITDGQEGFGTLASWFMAAASLGMVLGFGLSSYLLRKRIELGWVPVAGVAMAITSLVVATIDARATQELLTAGGKGFGAAAAVVLRPSSGGFLWALGALAFFAALFLAPLNAWMQDNYPPAKRGEFQAAVNLQDCFAGIAAAIFIELLPLVLAPFSWTELTIYRIEIALVGIACALITWFIIRVLTSDFVRVIGLTVLRAFYRIRAVDPENVPAKGGALLLPNHLSWADAFFITAASPRPVRFIMEAAFMKNAPIRAFCRIFDTLPISSKQPREALRTAAEALAAGDLVCLFPEGQLSRTGGLLELKRGFEIMARQSKCPVVPLWADGTWGSIFSFERNRFFKKRPYRIPYGIRIAFGKAIAPGEAGLVSVRAGIRTAAAAALHDRRRLFHWDAARTNGYQLGQLNALQRRQPFAVLAGDPLPAGLAPLRQFEILFKARRVTEDRLTDSTITHWVGGAALRARIEAGERCTGDAVFFDFSPQAAEPLDRPGWTHCPCLAPDGVIVSMSMPDPPPPYSGSRPQPGCKPGSYGIILPGHEIIRGSERVQLTGAAIPSGSLELPPGSTIDALDFVGRAPEQEP